MKPILLEFGAFGPYVDKQTVDFRSLESKGIFLICGETGSGKTMLLDAMTFALYGRSSGDLRNDFRALRSTQAEWKDATFVRFIFLTEGVYYLFERRLEPKAKNLADKYRACIYTGEPEADGSFMESEWEPLFENPKKADLDRKARELTGLDYDQFRQVIILPQGQFEKLLVSGSDEKEKILTTIFGVDKWQKIAEAFYGEAEENKNRLQARKDMMDRSLEEEGCSTVEELADLLDSTGQSLEKLKADHESLNLEERQKVLREQLSLTESFVALRERKAELAGLEGRAHDQEERKKLRERAFRAEKVRPLLVSRDQADKDHEKRLKGISDLKEKLGKAKARAEAAAFKLEEHKGLEGHTEELKKELVLCNEKKNDYLRVAELDAKVTDCRKKAEACERDEARVKEDLDRTETELAELQLKAHEMNATRQNMADEYLMGIGGELAEQLKDGCPCPVCGSTEHPHKAEKSPDHVSKADLDTYTDRYNAVFDKVESLRLNRDSIRNLHDTKKADTAGAKAALAASRASFAEAQASLIEGIDSIGKLEERIDLIQAETEQYSARLNELTAEVEKTRSLLDKCTQESEGAVNEEARAKETLDAACTGLREGILENGFMDEDEVKKALLDEGERNELTSAIASYETSLKAASEAVKTLEEKLRGTDEPDKAAVTAEMDAISAKEKEYVSESTRLSERIKGLTVKYGELKDISETYTKLIQQAEEDFIFAKSLRGDTGTGLQRYVLGIMFNSVIHAANEMLELVHDGRYYLVRTDDKEQGSNKRGLGLKAHDRFKDEAEPRFVSTMSGGEKFLISLALSIGLSNVARKGGIKIEALFIDEGFGSLDDESIEDAMNILDMVQRSNGVLGIISHVQILQERISSKLCVDKNKGRSTIRQVIG